MVNLGSDDNNKNNKPGFREWLKFSSRDKASLLEFVIICGLAWFLIMACGFIAWYAIFTDAGVPCKGLLCFLGGIP